MVNVKVTGYESVLDKEEKVTAVKIKVTVTSLKLSICKLEYIPKIPRNTLLV